ncbi:MAG: ATP-binding protein [Candidatus Kapabacteria bacterium]|nr:ATP-binding protein [Candidatus Kapabacteria bacterium]
MLRSYYPRIIDEQISRRLQSIGAVVIEGARAVGKTVTGEHHAASIVRVDSEVERQPLVREHPETLIDGEAPRLFDEWQVLPQLWNQIRREVDRRQQFGQFLLTGSAIPQDDITRHSGAGRFARVRMRPLSLHETLRPSSFVSMKSLLRGDVHVEGRATLEFRSLIDVMVRGGWPALLTNGTGEAQWVRDYVDETTRIDLTTIGTSGRSRDPEKIARVMRSLARSPSSEIRVRRVMNDTIGSDSGIARNTIEGYLDALRRVMLLEDVPAWQPHLRSSTELRTSPKSYFVDPSIGPAILRLTTDHLLGDINYVGQLFENLVMRDVLVYAQANDAKVSYYRDNAGLEIDAIIEGLDGAWIALEIKLGSASAEAAANSMHRFVKKVDTGRMGPPSSMIVITAGGYAITRSDGVHIVPIELLGP